MWIDIGCDDFEAAALNRYRVANGYGNQWWEWYEAQVRRYAHAYLMPWWLPQGDMIYLSEVEAKHLKKHGMHRVERNNG